VDQVVWDVGEEEDVGEGEDRSFSEGYGYRFVDRL
jgi:hypothetical protein